MIYNLWFTYIINVFDNVNCSKQEINITKWLAYVRFKCIKNNKKALLR